MSATPIKLEASVSIYKVEALVADLKTAVANGGVVLDMAAVESMDTVSAQAIVAAAKACHAQKLPFEVQNPSPHVTAVFSTLGLTLPFQEEIYAS